MYRRAALLLPLLAALLAGAQENAPIRLSLDTRQYTERILQPVMPRPLSFGAQTTLPPYSTLFPEQTPTLDRHTREAIASLPLQEIHFTDRALPYPSQADYNFSRNPYSRDRASAGVIALAGSGYITGASSYEAFPALGNFARASLAFTQPVGERFSFTAGVSGEKYHIGRNAWNSYGVFGQASYRLSDVLTLNAFGQHYWNQHAPSPAALPYQGQSLYGATMGIRMSETVSLDVGAQRYYDPYTRQWKTLPIVAPTVNLMGAPIRLDVGGLLYQILDNIFGNRNSYGSTFDYDPRSIAPMPRPAGFNPNSPVRIPDQLR